MQVSRGNLLADALAPSVVVANLQALLAFAHVAAALLVLAVGAGATIVDRAVAVVVEGVVAVVGQRRGNLAEAGAPDAVGAGAGAVPAGADIAERGVVLPARLGAVVDAATERRLVDAPVAVVVEAVADLGLGLGRGAVLPPAVDADLLAGAAGGGAGLLGAVLAVAVVVDDAVAVVVEPVAALGSRLDLAVAGAPDAGGAGVLAVDADALVPGVGRAFVAGFGHPVDAGAAVVDDPIAVVVEAVTSLGDRQHLTGAGGPDSVVAGALPVGAEADGAGVGRAFVASLGDAALAVAVLVDPAVTVVVDAVAHLGLGFGRTAVAGPVAIDAGFFAGTAVSAAVALAAVAAGSGRRFACAERACVADHLAGPAVRGGALHDRAIDTILTAAGEAEGQGNCETSHQRATHHDVLQVLMR